MKLGLQGVSVVFSSGDDGVECGLGKKQRAFDPNLSVTCK